MDGLPLDKAKIVSRERKNNIESINISLGVCGLIFMPKISITPLDLFIALLATWTK
jgi:hypothetical protein